MGSSCPMIPCSSEAVSLKESLRPSIPTRTALAVTWRPTAVAASWEMLRLMPTLVDLIEEGFYQVAGSLFHEGNQGRCSKDIETAALHGFCRVCVHDHDRCFSSGTNPKFVITIHFFLQCF